MASPKSQLWDYRCVKYTASHLRDLHFLSLHQLIWTVSFLCPWHLCPTVWILVPQNLPVPIPFPLLATTDVFLDMSFNLPEFCCWYSDFISTQHHVFETCACCSIHRNVIVSAHGIGFLEYVSTLLTCPHPWEGHSCNTDYTVPMRPSYMLPRDLLEQL